MNLRPMVVAASMLAVTACGVSDTPRVDAPLTRPDQILDFNALYSENCVACHGRDGTGGLALALADPEYLAIAGNTVIRAVTAKGVPGTSMPAFAQSSGGSLTDSQIDAIVSGIRTRWAKPAALAGENPPPYAADVPGDPARGAKAYETYCRSCHGEGGRASSIVDPAYLALVSEQSLRTTVIAGRSDLGSPDWRSDVPGKPMTKQDVSDVVAWLVAQKSRVSARR
jgi:cytochrome c oxidase cbb3-type subunit 3